MTVSGGSPRFTAEEVASGRARWASWVDDNIGGRESVRAAATEAALRVALAGSGAEVSAAAARQAAGRREDLRVLVAEVAHVRAVVSELDGLRPFARVTGPALEDLRSAYRERLEIVTAASRPAAVSAPTPPTPSPGPAPGSAVTARPDPPERRPVPRQPAVNVRPPGPSLTEFMGEHSILLLSYTGAFLLVVATVLFEIYGLKGLAGGLHFAGVLALLVVFAAAGFACLRSRQLRVVGHTYVAIAALLLPLTAIAAYVFLGLREHGISAESGVAWAGLGCAVTYGVLAVRLRATAYAYMSLAALPVAAVGTVNAIPLGPWRGAALSVLVLIFLLVTRSGRLRVVGDRFASIARPFVHGSAILAASEALVAVAAGVGTAPVAGWDLAVTAGAIAGVYLLANALGSRREDAVIGLLAFEATVVCVARVVVPEYALPAALAPAATAFAALHAFGRRAGGFGERLASESELFVHLAVLAALAAFALEHSLQTGSVPRVPEVMVGFLAVAYLLAARSEPAGKVAPAAAAPLALALLALEWLLLVRDALPAPWQPLAAGLLVAVLASTRLGVFTGTGLGARWRELAEPYGHAAAAVTVVWIGTLQPGGDWVSYLASWPNTLAYFALAFGYGMLGVLGKGLLPALLARALFAIAWLAAVQNLHLGTWRGPADVALTVLYVVLGYRSSHFGRVGELFRGSRELTVHASAAIALGLTVADAVSFPDLLSWRAAVTYGGLGAAYLLQTYLGGGRLPASLGLAGLCLALATASYRVVADPWAPLLLLGAAAAFVQLAHRGVGPRAFRVALAGPAEIYVHFVVLVMLGWLLVESPSLDSLGYPQLVAMLGIAALYALYSSVSGRRSALLASAAAMSVAVLGANHVLGLEDRGAALELVVLAALYAVFHEFARAGTLRTGLWIGMAAQALLPVLMNDLGAFEHAAVLLGSVMIFSAVAARSQMPEWLLFAVGLSGVAWYWSALALGPRLAGPTTAALALAFLPLPLLLGVLGLGLRSALGFRWAWPLYLGAGIWMLLVPVLAGADRDPGLAGRALVAYSVLVYTAAAVDSRWEGAVLFVAFAVSGTSLALVGVQAAPVIFVLALGALAAALYGGAWAWRTRFPGASAWVDTHRYAGLGGAGALAVSCVATPQFTAAGAPGGWAGLAVVLLFGFLLDLDGRLFRRPALGYLAAFVASLSSFWVARHFGAGNPQAYVALPALALLAIGLRLPHDRRIALDTGVARGAVVLGVVALLGTTAMQTFGESGDAFNYTGILVVEGVLAVVGGIAFRNRAMVVAGGAGLAIAALRALFVLIVSGIQLWIVFGAVALLLLLAGAALAVVRQHIPAARSVLRDSWQQWS